jgi:membrane protease YdiL (CAAX protease family)
MRTGEATAAAGASPRLHAAAPAWAIGRTKMAAAPLSNGRDAGDRLRGVSAIPKTSPLAAFWWACLLLGPPVAWAVAAAGFPMPMHDPLRDLVALLAWSVAEEIVFRGGLQPLLGRAFGARGANWTITPANVATSLVFAALHAWRHGPLVALGVFPLSLVYGFARDRSGRVAPAAWLHVWFNALLYAASWRLAAG